MEEKKKDGSYESFRDAVADYGDERGHDLLTDPAEVEASRQKSETEGAFSHGQRVKLAREERGFSLDELSGKTGIDVNLLAGLEAGENVLPLGQLIKLSKALDMKMADVISSGDEPFTIVRVNQRKRFTRFGKSKEMGHGYEYESLAPNKKDRTMEPFVVTLHPASADKPSTHDGQEFIYVLEGEMEVLVGEKREILGPGDAVYYDSTSNHLVRASGDKPARILAVLVS